MSCHSKLDFVMVRMSDKELEEILVNLNKLFMIIEKFQTQVFIKKHLKFLLPYVEEVALWKSLGRVILNF